MSEAWRESASCAQTDREIFFPEVDPVGAEQTRQALEICSRCPVQYECWWDEVAGGKEPWGIRGGRKPSELRSSQRALNKGGNERAGAMAAMRVEERRQEREAAESEKRALYLAGREERQREASRKYAAAKRAREREEREASDFPEQRQPEADVAEVA